MFTIACSLAALFFSVAAGAELDALKESLETGSPAERMDAAEALGATVDPGAPALLEAALADPNVFVRNEAANALAALASKEGVRDEARQALLHALRHGPSAARAHAAAALGMVGGGSALDHLMETLAEDSAPLVRYRAALALGRLGDARAVLPLIEALNDDANIARGGAAWALGELDDAQAIPPLGALLASDIASGDNYTTVQVYAAEALGKIGGGDAVEALAAALSERGGHYRYINEQIAMELEATTGENFGHDKDAWLEWWIAQGADGSTSRE